MNENQLTDQVTKGITKAASQIAAAVFFFIFYSASAATDLFYRRGFGLRFFTPVRALMGYAGWYVATGIGSYHEADIYAAPLEVPTKVLVAFSIISTLYLIAAVFHLREIRARVNSGEIWHSRSRGVRIWGVENPYRDMALDVVVAGGLWLLLPAWAIFYSVSRVMGYAADTVAANQFYNRLLDIRDAHIESEHMEEALRQSTRLYSQLPRHLRDADKQNIVRVVVGSRPEDLQPETSPSDSTGKDSPPQTAWNWIREKLLWLRSINVGSRGFALFALYMITAQFLYLGYRFIKYDYEFLAAKWHQFQSSKPTPPTESPSSSGWHRFSAANSQPPPPQAKEVDTSNQQPAPQVDMQEQLAQQKLLQQKRIAEEKARAKAEAQAKILQGQVDTLLGDFNNQQTLLKEYFLQVQTDLIENTNLIIANRIFTRSRYLDENYQFFQQANTLAKEQVKVYQVAKAAIDEFKATPGASFQEYKTRIDTVYSDLKKKRDAFAEQLSDFRKRILK